MDDFGLLALKQLSIHSFFESYSYLIRKNLAMI